MLLLARFVDSNQSKFKGVNLGFAHLRLKRSVFRMYIENEDVIVWLSRQDEELPVSTPVTINLGSKLL